MSNVILDGGALGSMAAGIAGQQMLGDGVNWGATNALRVGETLTNTQFRWRQVANGSYFRRDIAHASDSHIPMSIIRPSQTGTPTVVSVAYAIQTPSLIHNYTALPSVVSLTFAVQTPTVQLAQYPNVVGMTYALTTPYVAGVITAHPNELVVDYDLPTPNVGITGFAAPNTLSLALGLQTPKFVLTAHPGVVSTAFALHAPSINRVQYPSRLNMTMGLNATYHPDVVSAELAMQSPNIQRALSALVMTLNIGAPSVTYGPVTLNPTEVPMIFSTPLTFGTDGVSLSPAALRRVIRKRVVVTFVGDNLPTLNIAASRVWGTRRVQFSTHIEYLHFRRDVNNNLTNGIDPPNPPNTQDSLSIAVPNVGPTLSTLLTYLTNGKVTANIRQEVTYSDGAVVWSTLGTGKPVGWDRNKGPSADTLTIRCQQTSPKFPQDIRTYTKWTSAKVAAASITSGDSASRTIKIPAGAGDQYLPKGFFYGIFPGDIVSLGDLGSFTVKTVDYNISPTSGDVTLKG